jgi:hypothetical protein
MRSNARPGGVCSKLVRCVGPDPPRILGMLGTSIRSRLLATSHKCMSATAEMRREGGPTIGACAAGRLHRGTATPKVKAAQTFVCAPAF